MEPGDGHCRGVTFCTNVCYILDEEGEDVMLTIQNRVNELGHDVDFSDLRNTFWYPLKFRTDFLEAVRAVLGWDMDKFREMGRSAPRLSPIMTFYMRDLESIQTLISRSPVYWAKHYDIGDLEHGDIRENGSSLRLLDFPANELLCAYLTGYYIGAGELTGASGVEVVEVKCPGKGDPYHEFEIKWD